MQAELDRRLWTYDHEARFKSAVMDDLSHGASCDSVIVKGVTWTTPHPSRSVLLLQKPGSVPQPSTSHSASLPNSSIREASLFDEAAA